MKLLAGDFPKNSFFRVGNGVFQFDEGIKQEVILFEEIESLEVESEETKQKGGLAGAAVGGLAFGGAGAVVGAMVGRNNKTLTVVRIHFLDGRRLMAELPYKYVVEMRAALFDAESEDVATRRQSMLKRLEKANAKREKAIARKRFEIRIAVVLAVVVIAVLLIRESNKAELEDLANQQKISAQK